MRMRKNALLLASMALAVLLAGGVALAAPGNLDPTFGDGGKVLTGFGARWDYEEAYDAEVQPDGKVLAAGYHLGRGLDLALARYNRDGSLDGTFGGGDGKVLTDFSGYGGGNALVVQSDGKIVVAGYGVDSSFGDFALARFNANGTLDKTFGGDGKVTTDFGPRTYDEIFALILRPNGKLVAAGSTTRVSDFQTFYRRVALARYNVNGTLDKTFGGDGRVTSDVGPGDDEAQDLVLQPDGKMVVAGYSAKAARQYATTKFLMARYEADGSLDRTFSQDGKVTTDFGYDSAAFGLVLRPDGRLVASGDATQTRSSAQKIALARYTTDGNLDPSFGDGGRVTTSMGPGGGAGYDLARQPDGKLVAVGSFSNISLARYNPSGALDRTFGDDGRVFTRFRNSADAGLAVALSDGRIIAAGSSEYCNFVVDECETDFALARYSGE